MRIVVANLTSGGLSGGYRKYLTSLMPLLAADRRVSALSVFVPAGAAVEFDRSVDVRTITGWLEMKREVGRVSPDVVFVPTARSVDFEELPVVTMVRNMEPLTVPFAGNTWAEGVRNLARAWEARRACRGARRVIAVSNYVRDFVVSRWGIAEERVATVYHGVHMPQAASDMARTGSRTLFTAGSIRPARGLEDVLQALPRLDRDVELVIGGRVDRGAEGYAARLRRLALSLGVVDRVTWAGQLDAAAMTHAFRQSAVFVMTSRAEACPNTVLEAMSCGTACVSVDRPPMPEFFSDAALYYPAGDAQTLASQLQGLLANPAAIDRLSDAALRRARVFSWDVTTDRTIEELERTLS